MNKLIPIWVLIMTIFLGIVLAILFGASVRHISKGGTKLEKIEPMIELVSSFPSLVNAAMIQITSSTPLLLDNRFPEIDGFTKNNKIQNGSITDTGYLLLSVYDKDKGQSIVKLLKISNKEVVHQWVPNIKELSKLYKSKSNDFNTKIITRSRARIVHPLLLNDGGLMFHVGPGPVYKINSCSKIEFAVDGIFHHTLEKDAEGNIWIPSNVVPASYTFYESYKDDSIAKLSPEGNVLFNKSITKILVENGYRGLVFGAGSYEKDAMHLNDIQPAFNTTKFWMKNDLLISLRNRSTVLLYRPSTNKIIWLKTAEWINQHDVDFVGQSKISIFSNNSIRPNKLAKKKGVHFMDGHSDVYILDLANGKTLKPYSAVLNEAEVRTITEGRQEILENGDVFIEESNHGRILRISPEKIIWEFTTKYENKVAMVSWSRYLTNEQVKNIIPLIKKRTCL